jgi:hypothetical protein
MVDKDQKYACSSRILFYEKYRRRSSTGSSFCSHLPTGAPARLRADESARGSPVQAVCKPVLCKPPVESSNSAGKLRSVSMRVCQGEAPQYSVHA